MTARSSTVVVPPTPNPSPHHAGGVSSTRQGGGRVGAHLEDAQLESAHAIAAAVVDPEIPVLTLEDLGVLRGVERRDGRIVVKLTPTYTGCPATLAIQLAVQAALAEAGLADVAVETVLSPPWTTDDITEEGRRKLKDFGIAPPGRAGGVRALFGEETVACPKCGSTDTARISEFGSTACKALWRCRACAEPFDYFKCI
jgi:ring-1,2-phenylacetyl-CoA epoxidase subunit PaaD